MMRLLTSERLLNALCHAWTMRLLLLAVAVLADGASSAGSGACTRGFMLRLVASEGLLDLLHRAGAVLTLVARLRRAVVLLFLAAVSRECFLDLLHLASG